MQTQFHVKLHIFGIFSIFRGNRTIDRDILIRMEFLGKYMIIPGTELLKSKSGVGGSINLICRKLHNNRKEMGIRLKVTNIRLPEIVIDSDEFPTCRTFFFIF